MIGMPYYNRLYLKKMRENPFTYVPKDERIYFNVDFETKDVAKYCHCTWCPTKKLWWTGYLNSNLEFLIEYYGINENTTPKALNLIKGVK